MSYFSQIGSLTVQQFVTPAVGIAAALVLIRGFARKNSPTVGNFWVDITRALLYVLIPIAFIGGVIFVGQGAVQTLAGTVSIHDAINGVTQTIPRGPIGFMEAIKQLARTAVDSSMPIRPPRSRTRPGSPTGCRSSCFWSFPSPSPTPSARWWAASATALPSSPPW
jgi:hypothetical protein